MEDSTGSCCGKHEEVGTDSECEGWLQWEAKKGLLHRDQVIVRKCDAVYQQVL